MKTRYKAAIGLALLLTVSGAGALYLHRSNAGQRPLYRFAEVVRGSLIRTVSSTGTLNAVVTVQVGSQVSGQIKELLADFNAEVYESQVIAKIDPLKFETQVRQAEAELAVSRANVAIQRANLERAQTDLENAIAVFAANKAQTEKAAVALAESGRNLERKQALFKKKVISESQIYEAQALYDQASAQLKSAQAQEQAEKSLISSRGAAVKMAQAQLEYALAQVLQREAGLEQNRVDMEHTVIRSPVDGVVIERSVDIGQTVAASLQTPKLFTIAQDLRKMQVETDVDEADIGNIRAGQRAVFTVDAFAGKEFAGRILQVRIAPHTVQNVVTYTVVVSTENPDLQLLPGMTANVNIVVEERADVLKIANSALRFRPPDEETKHSSSQKEIDTSRRGLNEPGQAEERLKRLTEALELTAGQQQQIRRIYADMRQRIGALRQQGATPEDIRTAVQNLWESTRRAVLDILSAQQRDEFLRLNALRESSSTARGRVWVLDENLQPAGVDVTVGISDGQFTELISGNLVEGQPLIVGTNAVKVKTAAGVLGRFRF